LLDTLPVDIDAQTAVANTSDPLGEFDSTSSNASNETPSGPSLGDPLWQDPAEAV
jgi:hypothetical protein